MDAKQNVYDLQMKFFEIFKSQNPENAYLDTVFEIGGKKLYANKSRLTIVSSTLESMLSDRWTSKNDEFMTSKDESIQISDYSFEHFTEFLTFIYSGECSLTDENILVMIDMAEFYGVQVLKNACDNYLSKMKITMENVLPIMETSKKYSLVEVKKSVQHFISKNFMDIIKCEGFLNARKETVEVLVTFIADVVKPEELFQAVYEWVELQAKHMVEVNGCNLNEAIKAEITPFLPYFRFKEMSLTFLVQYVVQRGIFLSYNELSEILKNAMFTNVKVKVTNSNGQSISGSLPRGSGAEKDVISLKNRLCDNQSNLFILWNKYCEIPSTPSPIKKRNGVEWYLVYFGDWGTVAVLHQKLIGNNHYLLAEMIPDSPDFVVTRNCKIEIC